MCISKGKWHIILKELCALTVSPPPPGATSSSHHAGGYYVLIKCSKVLRRTISSPHIWGPTWDMRHSRHWFQSSHPHWFISGLQACVQRGHGLGFRLCRTHMIFIVLKWRAQKNITDVLYKKRDTTNDTEKNLFWLAALLHPPFLTFLFLDPSICKSTGKCQYQCFSFKTVFKWSYFKNKQKIFLYMNDIFYVIFHFPHISFTQKANNKQRPHTAVIMQEIRWITLKSIWCVTSLCAALAPVVLNVKRLAVTPLACRRRMTHVSVAHVSGHALFTLC